MRRSPSSQQALGAVPLVAGHPSTPGGVGPLPRAASRRGERDGRAKLTGELTIGGGSHGGPGDGRARHLMLWSMAFDRLGVAVSDLYFVDPSPGEGQDGAERGVRLELRLFHRDALKGSIYSAV